MPPGTFFEGMRLNRLMTPERSLDSPIVVILTTPVCWSLFTSKTGPMNWLPSPPYSVQPSAPHLCSPCFYGLTGNVLQEDQWYSSLTAELHKMGALQCRLGEQHPVVAHYADGPSVEAAEARDEGVAVLLLELVKLGAVDDPGNHLTDVEGPLQVGADQAVQIGNGMGWLRKRLVAREVGGLKRKGSEYKEKPGVGIIFRRFSTFFILRLPTHLLAR